MSNEFAKTDGSTVRSSNGFTVSVRFAGGVDYEDANGKTTIDTEWLVNPPRILLYRKRDSTKLGAKDKLYENAQRALEFLGHQVETWDC